MECLNCGRELGCRLRLKQMSNIRVPIGSVRTGNRNQVCRCSVCGNIIPSLVKINFPGKE